jgi:hypothetical protein
LGRIATVLLVVGLLGGTAAAFAVTEGLKLEKSPIAGTQVAKIFSPVCRCPTASASISFRLRHADHLTITIEDSSGQVVRTLFASRRTSAGLRTYFWNGRKGDGQLAPDGRYRPHLELDDADRAISLPNTIALDTTRPHVLSVGVELSKARVLVRYRASEKAHGILYVGGQRVLVAYRSPKVGTLVITRAALRARGATGHLAIAVRDLAGNRSKVRALRYVIRRGT